MINSYKLGPGELTLDDGTAFDASAQVRNCRVEWSESTTSTDAIPVLSGEEIAGEEDATYAAKLAGTFLQDLEAAGLVAWTWARRGQTVDFTFVPSSAAGRACSGQVRVVPLNLGGDVKSRPDADFSWACIGEPALGASV